LTGFPFILTALLAAIILGGIISGVFILITVAKKQYRAFQAIPYGPFIIIGGIIALYLY
jgi:prepilin signal peptidase PulO-like enzyme (type II secretory pathway)